MNEDKLTRLRLKLDRWRSRLHATSPIAFIGQLTRFYHFLRGTAFLEPIITKLYADCQSSVEANNAMTNSRPLVATETRHILNGNLAKYLMSAKAEEYAAFTYHLIRGSVDTFPNWQLQAIMQQSVGLGPGANGYKYFANEFLDHFCDYLDDQLDEQQAITGLLVQYKKRSEWFNRSELFRVAEAENAKNDDGKRAWVEDALKADLYRYLHDQGIDFHIEPKADRGRIDLILDQKEPVKYIEGKVFDNDGRDKGYIKKGFGQLLDYLRQYNSSTGYLLIYKTCEESLVVDGSEHLGHIPFLRREGKTIYFFIVDICLHKEAVSQRKYDPILLTIE